MYGLSRDRRLSVQFYQIAMFHCFIGGTVLQAMGSCLSEATYCSFHIDPSIASSMMESPVPYQVLETE